MSVRDIIDTVNYNGMIQVVSFKIGDEEFGVNILQVQEINRLVQITRVPNAPDFIEGVMNLRGRIVPVVNLRKRFGLQQRGYDKNTRVVVVELNDKTVGFIVDSVSEVLRFSKNDVEPTPDLITGIGNEYITGIAKLGDRLLILLDLEKVLTVEEKESLKEALLPQNEN